MSAPRRQVAWAAMLACLVLGLLAAPSAAAAADAPGGAANFTTADPVDSGGPLDFTEVTIGQRDVRMTLRVVSTGPWDSQELTSVAGRALCVTLVDAETDVATAHICVTRREGRTALDLTPLDPDGTPLTPRVLAADPARPQPNVLEMAFLPAAAGLSIGPFAWFADSAWTDDSACAAICRDRAPDSGSVAAGVVLIAVPRCFGAAARDAAQPCENPALHNAVEPPPARGKVIADPLCDRIQRARLVTACGFGAMPGEAERTFALIGDSHAANLKPALLAVTLAKRWRGVSILRSGCPLTRGAPILTSPQRSQQCVDWNRQVRAWLAKHPEVDTIFLSAHTGARVTATDGRSDAEAVHSGYREVIRALLRMHRRVVVVRDSPPMPLERLRCVARAIAAGRRAQSECTRPRSRAVRADPLVDAARSVGSSNVKVIDLTRYFCDTRRCFTVVGGALVRHDESHLTQAFAATLGPFVLRALDR